MKIYKYVIEEKTTLELPVGAVVLTVDSQHGKVCVWIAITETPVLEQRVFKCIGTGGTINCNIDKYINTVMLYGGDIVMHVFEEIELHKHKK